MAQIKAAFLAALFGKVEELLDVDPANEAAVAQKQNELRELTLAEASSDEKHGWLNDNALQGTLARLGEKAALAKPADATGPAAPREEIDPNLGEDTGNGEGPTEDAPVITDDVVDTDTGAGSVDELADDEPAGDNEDDA